MSRKLADGNMIDYCRRERSLGILCQSFLSVYGWSHKGATISLDTAAVALKVERRRIYDIINVLESINVVARRAKNCYVWYGFEHLDDTLTAIQNQHFSTSQGGNTGAAAAGPTMSNATDNNSGSQADNPSQTNAHVCKEKSLGLLSQKFIKLLLSKKDLYLSLDDAATELFTDEKTSAKRQTKVRRLYDIANILSSLSLIQKVATDQKRPGFQWIWERGQPYIIPVAPKPAPNMQQMNWQSINQMQNLLDQRTAFNTFAGIPNGFNMAAFPNFIDDFSRPSCSKSPGHDLLPTPFINQPNMLPSAFGDNKLKSIVPQSNIPQSCFGNIFQSANDNIQNAEPSTKYVQQVISFIRIALEQQQYQRDRQPQQDTNNIQNSDNTQQCTKGFLPVSQASKKRAREDSVQISSYDEQGEPVARKRLFSSGSAVPSSLPQAQSDADGNEVCQGDSKTDQDDNYQCDDKLNVANGVNNAQTGCKKSELQKNKRATAPALGQFKCHSEEPQVKIEEQPEGNANEANTCKSTESPNEKHQNSQLQYNTRKSLAQKSNLADPVQTGAEGKSQSQNGVHLDVNMLQGFFKVAIPKVQRLANRKRINSQLNSLGSDFIDTLVNSIVLPPSDQACETNFDDVPTKKRSQRRSSSRLGRGSSYGYK